MANQVVEVVIETAKGDANEYEWDARVQAIRLRRTRFNSPQSFEYGHIANSLTAHGEPLSALVLISVPTFAGCFVDARVIGAIEQRESESTTYLVITVAERDARLANIQSRADLDAAMGREIENLLGEGAQWLETDAAHELVHASKQRWMLTRVEKPTGRASPAWKADEGIGNGFGDQRETIRHTRAEQRLYTLPTRFQNYVASLLLPDERILLWVYRPLMTPAHRNLFGREVLRQGVLVITDQQFLWMVDPVTPSLTVEGYGYIARTFALERLRRIELEEGNKSDRLNVSLSNARGNIESFTSEFPVHARADLDEAIRLLNRFLPCADESRLMRSLSIESFTRELNDPTTGAQESTRATIACLQEMLAKELNGEKIYAQAFIPKWDDGAKLVTVTDQFVRLVFDTQERYATPLAIPLETVGSVELCSSQLGSWFRLWLPTRVKLEKWEMHFPHVMVKGFNDCAVVLRHLLKQPTYN